MKKREVRRKLREWRRIGGGGYKRCRQEYRMLCERRRGRRTFDGKESGESEEKRGEDEKEEISSEEVRRA